METHSVQDIEGRPKPLIRTLAIYSSMQRATALDSTFPPVKMQTRAQISRISLVL